MSKSAAKTMDRPVEAASNGAYQALVGGIASVIDEARRAATRSVNAAMTAAYWLIGGHIVEFEQGGRERGEYGRGVVERLASDLSARYGRGFSARSLWQMRAFYVAWPVLQHEPASLAPVAGKLQTLSAESELPREKLRTPSAESEPPSEKLRTASAELASTPPSSDSPDASGESQPPAEPPIRQTPSSKFETHEVASQDLVAAFPLPWSAYVRLLSVKNPNARRFYEAEALRGGWSVRQLDRQISSQFYERTALSKDKAKMLKQGAQPQPTDALLPEQAIKDPFVLEFLNLKDEYSESDLEEAMIRRLESFLMELGGDFCFVGRQRRLRIDDEWYRVDLAFFHRVLRCLVLIDLKVGKFTHADAGQMHLYLNYAREHWVHEHENPPVGLILCAEKGESLARYALEGLPNKVMAAEYRTALPDETVLAAEIERARGELELKREGQA